MTILRRLLGKEALKDYADIVAPLKQIEIDLSTYIGDQKNNISGLEETKEGINEQISAVDVEIKKSEFTVVKISELLSSDLEVKPVEELETPKDDKGTP